MPQCVSEMVQVSNFYLQRDAAKILNKALLKFGRKPKLMLHKSFEAEECFYHEGILRPSVKTFIRLNKLMKPTKPINHEPEKSMTQQQILVGHVYFRQFMILQNQSGTYYYFQLALALALLYNTNEKTCYIIASYANT